MNAFWLGALGVLLGVGLGVGGFMACQIRLDVKREKGWWRE